MTIGCGICETPSIIRGDSTCLCERKTEKATKGTVKRVIDLLVNRRDNNDIPPGVSLKDFETTINTLYAFLTS